MNYLSVKYMPKPSKGAKALYPKKHKPSRSEESKTGIWLLLKSRRNPAIMSVNRTTASPGSGLFFSGLIRAGSGSHRQGIEFINMLDLRILFLYNIGVRR